MSDLEGHHGFGAAAEGVPPDAQDVVLTFVETKLRSPGPRSPSLARHRRIRISPRISDEEIEMSVNEPSHDDIAAFVDQSCLKPDAVMADIDAACDEALQLRYRGLVVPSGAVSHAKRRLTDSGVRVVCVVGFPHGTQAPDVKANEAMRAAALGADEVDYVISIGAALEGDTRYLREEGVAILRQTRGKLVKAILEVGYLNEEQTYNSARMLAEAGMHYVKTCTGYGPGVCTAEIVRLLCRAVGDKALVKASGGIKEKWQAIEMIEAGAAVIGTSHGSTVCVV